MIKTIVFYCILLLLLFGVLEIALRLIAYRGLLPLTETLPTNDNMSIWGDINADFGVWHYPNREYRHQKSCFDVQIRTNSYGARDPERVRLTEDTARVVVLGDSFVEGYGVSVEDRFSNLLERETGKTHLNFGTSGDFGFIQEMRLYETLASTFSHDSVWVFFFSNDWTDAQPSVENRYKPLLKKENDSLKLYYPFPFAVSPSSQLQPQPLSFALNSKRWLANHFYFFRLTHFLKENVLKAIATKEPLKEPAKKPVAELASSLDKDPSANKPKTPAIIAPFTEEQWQQLIYSYERILLQAGDKPVHFFTIPTLHDWQAYQANPQPTYYHQRFTQWLASKKNAHYHDFLPLLYARLKPPEQDYRHLLFPCDGHWNVAGHRVIADIIKELMYKN